MLGDELLFDEEERKPSEEQAIQCEAITKFSPEEKKTLKEVLEGLILKHEAKRWSAGGITDKKKCQSAVTPDCAGELFIGQETH
jgi:hypothetical protein